MSGQGGVSVFARVYPWPASGSNFTERDNLKVWLKAHATRLYAVLSVAVVVAAHYRPGIPVDAVLTGAGALLGVGEAAQRAAKSIAKGVPVAKRKP